MEDARFSALDRAQSRVETNTATLLGQVMFLVAVAIGFMVLGTVIGRDLSESTARICFYGGFGMVLVSSFVNSRVFRVGTFAVVWLYAIALLMGLGLGPIIAWFAENDPTTITQAAGCTALAVLGTGFGGWALRKDLSSWQRPMFIIGLVLVVVVFGMALTANGGNPVLSGAIGIFSAVSLVVYFNVMRKHGTEDDAVMLATGIFISIVNIFLSLLNILGR